MAAWRVYWVLRAPLDRRVRETLGPGWEELRSREAAVGVQDGDPIFLAPDYRVDLLLGLYGQSRTFRRYTAETRRNYSTDLTLFMTFLWSRGRRPAEATQRDMEDYEHWRRIADGNPARIGGSKWDRELAAFASFYGWAVKAGHLPVSPVQMKQVLGRSGEVLSVAAARAKDARPSNVHWLTPRTWRRWIDVGLRGNRADGVPEPGWVGRLEDRNVAFVRTLTSSGLRRSEGGSLLTFEIPRRQPNPGRYCRGKIAAQVTRSKKPRTFYISSEAVGDIEAYEDSSRACAVRQAQKTGRYEALPRMWMVTEVTRGLRPVVRWCDATGMVGRRELDQLTVEERMWLFTDGPHGPEPLWLWLNEQGMPLRPHSWEGVFRVANERCARLLTPPRRLGMDPHKVYAPYATPHSARHSFALFMLVVLNHLMDHRYGLTAQDRRDFRQLYGDPWFMVQNLLGHASRETTIKHYLAPVADLQLRAMLTTAGDPVEAAPMPELDAVFARIARESEGIQDIGTHMGER